MTDFLQLVASLREQMTANLSRTDVLRPLAWLMGMLLTALVAAIVAKAAPWIVLSLLATTAASGMVYVGSYVFCLIVDRDALRSERYSLQKLAIEQGIYGDSRIGLVDPNSDTAIRAIASPTTSGSAE